MKRKVITKLFALAFVLMLCFTATDAFSQCAMCRATVESNVGTGSKNPESSVGAGLNKGILYLMAVPYLLIGTVGFFWYRNSRKSHA